MTVRSHEVHISVELSTCLCKLHSRTNKIRISGGILLSVSTTTTSYRQGRTTSYIAWTSIKEGESRRSAKKKNRKQCNGFKTVGSTRGIQLIINSFRNSGNRRNRTPRRPGNMSRVTQSTLSARLLFILHGTHDYHLLLNEFGSPRSVPGNVKSITGSHD
jgi:hypothetical protein